MSMSRGREDSPASLRLIRSALERQPAAPLGGFLDRVENTLHLEPVGEVGVKRLACVETRQKIRHRGDEGVFVSNDVTGRPKMADVRMFGIGYQDVGGALEMR